MTGAGAIQTATGLCLSLMLATSAGAVPPLPPADCFTDSGQSYNASVFYTGGFVVTDLQDGTTSEIQLIACTDGHVVRVPVPEFSYDGYLVLEQMNGLVESPTAYTLEQIADIFRINGFDASVAQFVQPPCVCALQ